MACLLGLFLWAQAKELWMPDGFVSLKTVAPEIETELRYAGNRNFLGRPVQGYTRGRCILTRPAAEALSAVQADLKPQGLSLKVYDCYRPQAAVNDFIQWAQDAHDQKMKGAFYPHIEKASLFEKGYIAEKSGHSRGSTVDLTLISLPSKSRYLQDPGPDDCTHPKTFVFRDNSLDMGTAFDCFDPLAHTNNPMISPLAKHHRNLLKAVMEKHGFRNLPEEWWHYTLQAEPYPDTYFNFPVE